MGDDATRDDGPRHTANAQARAALDGAAAALMTQAASDAAATEIASWPLYAPTPLRDLPGMARAVGVGALLYKDEAHRFGLGSFKALGGAYAVLRVLQDALRAQGVEAGAADLAAGRHRDAVAALTMCCATDGNHGRSVAWGAQTFGCRSRIYIHEGVSADREAAIRALGATTVRLEGDYDASVRACARDAAANGWTLVADTDAGGGSPDIPALVMQGYTLIVRELLDALDAAPSHVFVPAGVGGLAAAVAGYWTLLGPRPRVVAVEPHAADCVFRALRDGRPAPLRGDIDSFMACLSAGEVSPLAWPVLRQAVDDAVAIPDAAAVDAMRALADGRHGDAPLVSGESGCAAVAALMALADRPDLRRALDLGPAARVVAIGSEGATAPDLWEAVVGRAPTAVAAGRG